jgi:hypothetical protein
MSTITDKETWGGIFYSTKWGSMYAWSVDDSTKMKVASFVEKALRKQGLEDSLHGIHVNVYPASVDHPINPGLSVHVISKAGKEDDFSRKCLTELNNNLQVEFAYASIVIPGESLLQPSSVFQ